jgi:DNA-binding LytR/AlgR family response regulator
MQLAICDDEKEIRELLGSKIQKLCPNAIINYYATGKDLLSANIIPDILFLDIQMPEIDGMETARKLRKINKDTILIFVTAIEEYVFQAFDVGAFHYIVKPFCDEKLKTVLQKAVDQYCKTMGSRQKQGGVPEKKHIMIQSGGTHTKIYLDKIVYAEVFNRKIIIHMTDGEIEYYGKLSELEKLLGEDFFRPHRAYLIHFKFVVKYDASTIYLEQGSVLMAKQNYPEFVKQYLRYNQRKGSV